MMDGPTRRIVHGLDVRDLSRPAGGQTSVENPTTTAALPPLLGEGSSAAHSSTGTCAGTRVAVLASARTLPRRVEAQVLPWSCASSGAIDMGQALVPSVGDPNVDVPLDRLADSAPGEPRLDDLRGRADCSTKLHVSIVEKPSCSRPRTADCPGWCGDASPPPPIPDDVGNIGIGSRIEGRFELAIQIGHGGMGDVYRAFDHREGKTVAIKVIRRGHVHDPRATGRFATEIRAMARVAHPNVVAFVTAGTYLGIPYAVMDWMDGGDLGRLLEVVPNHRLAPYRAASIASAVSRGVEAMHRAGFVHGDLKPANILMTFEGRVAVADLGMARPMAECCRHTAGEIAGTPTYLAPELTMGHPVTPAPTSDVYALGVLTFRMVTGRLPFEADSLSQVLYLHATEPPPRPSALRPDLPRAMDDAIVRALAKDPDDRHPSPEAFGRAIMAGFASPPRPRWPRFRRRR